ncbi:hypothetical protein GCM10027280_00030 [Micromonospora polyrhachis]
MGGGWHVTVHHDSVGALGAPPDNGWFSPLLTALGNTGRNRACTRAYDCSISPAVDGATACPVH